MNEQFVIHIIFDLFKKTPNFYFIIILLLFLILYNIILFFFKDKKKLKIIKKEQHDIKIFPIDKLNYLPLVNIIIPAWNEGENFRKCLKALLELSYPYKQIVTNVGGDIRTIKIAESFRTDNNLKILYQKKGEGKIKAINDCIELINQGLIYIIDADVLLTDKVFLNMIKYLINDDYDIILGSIIPHNTILNQDIVKYNYINGLPEFRKYYKPNEIGNAIGVNFCFNYRIIEKIGKFPEAKRRDDNLIIASTLKGKKFDFYHDMYIRAKSFTYPSKIKDTLNQRIRWMQNYILNLISNKKYKNLIKIILVTLLSSFIIFSPILLFLNYKLFLVGLFLYFYFYLKKIRQIIFFKLIELDKDLIRISLVFYFKLFFYVFLDIILKPITIIDFLLFGKKRYERRKNLEI